MAPFPVNRPVFSAPVQRCGTHIILFFVVKSRVNRVFMNKVFYAIKVYCIIQLSDFRTLYYLRRIQGSIAFKPLQTYKHTQPNHLRIIFEVTPEPFKASKATQANQRHRPPASSRQASIAFERRGRGGGGGAPLFSRGRGIEEILCLSHFMVDIILQTS